MTRSWKCAASVVAAVVSVPTRLSTTPLTHVLLQSIPGPTLTAAVLRSETAVLRQNRSQTGFSQGLGLNSLVVFLRLDRRQGTADARPLDIVTHLSTPDNRRNVSHTVTYSRPDAPAPDHLTPASQRSTTTPQVSDSCTEPNLLQWSEHRPQALLMPKSACGNPETCWDATIMSLIAAGLTCWPSPQLDSTTSSGVLNNEPNTTQFVIIIIISSSNVDVFNVA